MSTDVKRQARWYFGGLSSAIAACFTHPLDLIKVQKQTQQGKLASIPLAKKILREGGLPAIYNGISASFLRQMTYSMTRFALYEIGRDTFDTTALHGKITLAGISGLLGGFVGTPGDMVNVRMQNDFKLSPDKRRNYKHCIDGLIQVYKKEGFKTLFSGASTASIRGSLVTIGQIAFYEQIKGFFLSCSFSDTVGTHLVSSIGAGGVAVLLSQPLDVMKTRAMNAPKGHYSGLLDIVKDIARAGPLGFYKGTVPAFIRIAPHTIILFLTFEQLRLHFGYIPQKSS